MIGEDDRSDTGEESPLAAYRIELETFQGPLDLLLHLIRKNEVDIYDIPIAEITRQYLHYLDIMKELDLEIASEFLVMASNLVYIKSRMLLPVEDEDEEEETEDPREELVRRLIEYQKYKEAAGILAGKPVLHHDVFPRSEPDQPAGMEEQFAEATLFQLMDAFQKALTDAEKRLPVEFDRESFTMEEAIILIRERLAGMPSLAFEALFEELDSKRKIITVFLGVLEMIKKGHLIAVQGDYGDPITLIVPEDVKQDMAENAPPEEGNGANDQEGP
jgi:segregation and condensation protein A